MPEYTIPIPAGMDSKDTAADLHQWLADHGATVQEVSIHSDGTATITADRAPDFTGYQSKRPGRDAKLNEAIADAKPLIMAIMRKPAAQRTQQEKIVAGLAAAIWQQQITD